MGIFKLRHSPQAQGRRISPAKRMPEHPVRVHSLHREDRLHQTTGTNSGTAESEGSGSDLRIAGKMFGDQIAPVDC